VEYYDAKLRDGYSNEVAVASREVNQLDDRRKSLATVNPLLAKTSALPPQPNVEDVTFENISINLPVMAQKALEELEKRAAAEDATDNEEAMTDSPTITDEATEESVASTDEAIERDMELNGEEEELNGEDEELNDEEEELNDEEEELDGEDEELDGEDEELDNEDDNK